MPKEQEYMDLLPIYSTGKICTRKKIKRQTKIIMAQQPAKVAQANNYLFRAARDQDQIRNMVVNVCYLYLKYCINCKAFDFPQTCLFMKFYCLKASKNGIETLSLNYI